MQDMHESSFSCFSCEWKVGSVEVVRGRSRTQSYLQHAIQASRDTLQVPPCKRVHAIEYDWTIQKLVHLGIE